MKDTMIDVLVAIDCIEWLLKNQHYRAQDEWFYALHQLAERIGYGYEADDLKECYWLGWKNSLPPKEEDIREMSLDKLAEFKNGAETNHDLLNAVLEAAKYGVSAVENAKKEPGIPGGVHAILDDISKTFLRAEGLTWRSLSSGMMSAQPQSGDVEDASKALGSYMTIVAAPEADY